MFNRAEARVDLERITANIKHLKQLSSTPVMAVVKADAYGHGLVPVAKAALDAGATSLGVALLEEAITLRQAGITAPILAWLVPPGSDFKLAVDNQIELAASSSIKALEEDSVQSNQSFDQRCILEVDTGMSRGGFLDEWGKIDGHHVANLDIVGIFSHFARADEPGEEQNDLQRKRFRRDGCNGRIIWLHKYCSPSFKLCSNLERSRGLDSTWCELESRCMDFHQM